MQKKLSEMSESELAELGYDAYDELKRREYEEETIEMICREKEYREFLEENRLAEFAIENGLPIGPTGEPVGW
ncbi:hypothetical protein QFX17_03240 [Lactobacillus helveticus]|uniref:hypothetical protein n=1 Tax=Lactobacillus helveticus TaxID=1587 RepID=UPI001561DBE0|nr:hypothetical protein [Lactobacillus helveticus]MCO0806814.1 hypothetical protein [Lactobacillus helveticus]MCP9316923.1 hypothetical protein [Lactobacillus helveticus]MDH5817304.1 hypothetical protein [Lactobacillus helveticus]NRO39366.1 hypothetical protein [Lactobacillus helveticus]NRO76499.1 hypothetical protein [Lactobacillus helveticus]